MHRALLIGLTFVVASEAIGAEKPIPQDIAKMEKRARELVEWNQRTLEGAYDKVGSKDPRWDRQAREGLELAARQAGERATTVTSVELHKAIKAAVDAGCDDPLVLNIYARTSAGPDFPGAEEYLRRIQSSCKALGASRYPAFRRARAIELATSTSIQIKAPDEEGRKAAESEFDAALALLPESVATDERNVFWEDRWFDILQNLIQGYRKLGMQAPAAYQRVDDKLAKLPDVKVLRLQVRGSFWNNYGWEARTNAFAPQVPEKAFEVFHKRVADAQKAYNEAWELRPDDARTADALIDIDKSIGGDRATMELWFDRAMKANGDMVTSCRSKLDWLDPKWHGTVEEMLAFGHACAATKNWQAGITLLAGDALRRYWGIVGQNEGYVYLRKPEVWAETQSVYEEYLKHDPDDAVARSKYASICTIGGHYAEAHAQFEILGDRLTSWTDMPYFPLPTLQQMRQNARVAHASEVRHEKKAADAKKDGAAKP